MSHSKFESLPNEILIELFEKYINGVDLVNAFAFQLNQRMDQLIHQCRRFYFDFIQCRKKDFQFCMDRLPAYIDRIEKLALSDHQAPGQNFAFLSVFPSFGMFKQLRRLYFHPDMNTCEEELINEAMQSLCHTDVHSLNVIITQDDRTNEWWADRQKEFAYPPICEIYSLIVE